MFLYKLGLGFHVDLCRAALMEEKLNRSFKFTMPALFSMLSSSVMKATSRKFSPISMIMFSYFLPKTDTVLALTSCHEILSATWAQTQQFQLCEIHPIVPPSPRNGCSQATGATSESVDMEELHRGLPPNMCTRLHHHAPPGAGL